MTSPFMSFHVASHAEGLAAPRLRALVRLLASVAMAVDAQATRPGKCLVAGGADVAVLRLRESRLARCADVVVMLPYSRRVGCICGYW